MNDQLLLPTDEAPPARQFQSFSEPSAFIWAVADLLRGDFKRYDFGKVILPFTVLRRLDCLLESSKADVLEQYDALNGGDVKNPTPTLRPFGGLEP
ncbi:MAG: type I restriction-modification system subunit M N-terminal domain-containing protein [Myxococcota bacterium]